MSSWNAAAAMSAIHALAEAKTGITWRWANTDAAAPAMPYGTLNIISGPTPLGGHAREEHYDEDADAGEEVILKSANQGTMTVSANVFTASQAPTARAGYYLDLLLSTLGFESTAETLNAVGLAVSNQPAINDLSDLAGAHIRSRAQADIRFNVRMIDSEATGYIETVDITPTVTDPDGSTVVANTEFSAP